MISFKLNKMDEATTNEEVVGMVMNAIENFYFDDGPESGEAIFNAFAAKHAALFEVDCEAIG